MLFQVPQVIEVEDKIIGPFTFKQFIYIAGGAGLSFILFKIFPLFISVFLIAPVAALSLALAFYRMNDQPFIQVLQSMLPYTLEKNSTHGRKPLHRKRPRRQKSAQKTSPGFLSRGYRRES